MMSTATTTIIYPVNGHNNNPTTITQQPKLNSRRSTSSSSPSSLSTTTSFIQRRNSLPRTSSSSSSMFHNDNNINCKKQYYCVGSGIGYSQQQQMETSSTSTVSLHYISQYLTPDTLILPQKFLQIASTQHNQHQQRQQPQQQVVGNVNNPHHICHHHLHHHNLHHQQQQQQQEQQHRIHFMLHNELRNANQDHHHHQHHQSTGVGVDVDAATAQLEEIIRLCRTLQRNSLTNSNGSNHYYHCSGCQISSRCRCSADCIQYFLQDEQKMKVHPHHQIQPPLPDATKNGSDYDDHDEENILSHNDNPETINNCGVAGGSSEGDDLVSSLDVETMEQNGVKKFDANIAKCEVVFVQTNCNDQTTVENLQYRHQRRHHKELNSTAPSKTCGAVDTTVVDAADVVAVDISNVSNKSTPPILDVQQQQQIKQEHLLKQNVDANINNSINNPNRFVTSLVAKFEEKKCLSTSPTVPTSTTTIPKSSLFQLMGQHQQQHSNNSKFIRDKQQQHQLETDIDTSSSFTTKLNVTDSQPSSLQQQQQSSLLPSTEIQNSTNDKCVQQLLPTTLPNTKTTIMDPSLNKTATIKTFSTTCSSSNEDHLHLKSDSTKDITTTKPKPKAKPKPPPKPASLALLSSLSSPTPTVSSESSCTLVLNDHDKIQKSSSNNQNQNSQQGQQQEQQQILSGSDESGNTAKPSIISDHQNKSSQSLLETAPETFKCHGDNQQQKNLSEPTIIVTLQKDINKDHNDDDQMMAMGESTSDGVCVGSMSPQQQQTTSPSSLLKVTDLDPLLTEKKKSDLITTAILNYKESSTSSKNRSSTESSSTNKKCQSYCCCCCCPNSGSPNNTGKLLGIDLTKIQATNANTNKISSTNSLQTNLNTLTTTKPIPKPRKSTPTTTTIMEKSSTNSTDLTAKDSNQPQPPSSVPNKRKALKCADIVDDSEVLVVVEEVNSETNSEETSPIGSSSDNSSSDEGIENPAVLDDDEELDDEVELLDKSKLSTDTSSCHYHQSHRSHSSHSHHQHHFNHHNKLVNHFPDSRKSPSLSFKSSRTVSPLFPNSTNPDDVHQVERFLNGTNSKHLNALKQEEALLLKEITELELEQSDTTSNSKENEEIDEELLEFQRIEREIKLSELRKCLQIVQKQIETYKNKFDHEQTSKNLDFDSVTMATTTSDLSLLNEQSQLDSSQQKVENDITSLIKSKSPVKAPLAEPENDEADLKADSIEPFPNPELDLSDSDDGSDSDEVAEPITPKADNIDKEKLVRSLDDLLHETIETRLEKVNDLTELEQESFVTNSAKPDQACSSLTRRTSQYDNEKPHDCRMKHFGYQRNVDMLMLKSVYQKLELDKQNPSLDVKHDIMNVSSISNEMLESTTTATDSETDSIVLRRRSARFPADDEKNSNPNLKQSQDELSTHSDQPVLRKRNSAISANSSTVGGSQRPLTLYMPAPNQKINLITHLHALGHDLTSSIVTNHLLLTPYTCSGYLYKHCSSGVGKWRKRYFHFDRVRKVFVYYHDRANFEKMRHPKRGVFFDEIQDVYVDHTRINMKKFLSSNSGNDKQPHLSNQRDKYGSPGAMTSPAKADGTRCVFVVSTTTFSLKFILSTYTPELMRIWMDVIFTGAQAYLQDFDDQMN